MGHPDTDTASRVRGDGDLGASRRTEYTDQEYAYTHRDVILYALSVGCKRWELRFVYENHASFAALPTHAVIPAFRCMHLVPLHQLLPNYNPALLLHAEQFLELKQPWPTAARTSTSARILDLQDKGKAALAVIGTTTRDSASGAVLAENEFTTYIRGAGGFQSGPTQPATRNPAAQAANKPPDRPPDAVIQEQTDPSDAALYRLNGDANPLHIDPSAGAAAGFGAPILHGLCSFGISAKHVLQTFGAGEPAALKSIKVRFSKHVFPGEMLQTEAWVVSPTAVIFRTRVMERDVIALSNAAVEFHPGGLRHPAVAALAHAKL